MSKPVTAWCVTNCMGDLLSSTVAKSRTDSIKEMVGWDDDGWRKRWRYWYRKHGCRCVRVRLVTDAEGK